MLILVADDHLENREMLSRRLVRRGFTVVEAADGAQAVDVALSARPALILMDVSMPTRCGIEATRMIRAAAPEPRPAIIALTAHAMGDAQAQAMAAGCDAFVTKPIDFAALLATMARLGVAPPASPTV